MTALAVFCPHGTLYAAHVINERSTEEDARAWLEPLPDDRLEIVESEEVRLRSGPCGKCRQEGRTR